MELSRELVSRLDNSIETILSAIYKKWLLSGVYDPLYEAGMITQEEFTEIKIAIFYNKQKAYRYKDPTEVIKLSKALNISYLDVHPDLTVPHFNRGTYSLKLYPKVEIPLNIPEKYIEEVKKQYNNPVKLYSSTEFLKYLAVQNNYNYEDEEKALIAIGIDIWVKYGQLPFIFLGHGLTDPIIRTAQEVLSNLLDKHISYKTTHYLLHQLIHDKKGIKKGGLLLDKDVVKIVSVALTSKSPKTIIEIFKKSKFTFLQNKVGEYYFEPLFFRVDPLFRLTLDIKYTSVTPSLTLTVSASSKPYVASKELPINDSYLREAISLFKKYTL